MKDIREVYQALLDGKTLIHRVGHQADLETSTMYEFSRPEDWEIYKPEWKMEPAGWWISQSGSINASKVDFISSDQKFGVKFHIKEQAKKARDQMKKANLLRYWVSTLQDLDEGNHFIECISNKYYYGTERYPGRISLDRIYMTKKTAEIICDALNSGGLKL